MHGVVSKKKIKQDEGISTKDHLLDLMIDYYELSDRIFVPGRPFSYFGTADEIIAEMERVVMERWAHQAGFDNQVTQLTSVLQRYQQLKNLLGFDQ